MSNTITDRLPIERVADKFGDAVVDSIHRVGELVPDHVPDLVADAVADGASTGRRFGRDLLNRVPGRSQPSSSRRWLILASVVGVTVVALVVWRRRTTPRTADLSTRDDWRLGDADGTSRSVA